MTALTTNCEAFAHSVLKRNTSKHTADYNGPAHRSKALQIDFPYSLLIYLVSKSAFSFPTKGQEGEGLCCVTRAFN